MMIFHVRYKTGATFAYRHEVKTSYMMAYLFNQFRRDPSVERVLAEVQ